MGLQDLLNNDDDRRDFGDFAERYHRGRVDEGYDDDEARQRYHRSDRSIDDDEYERAAREAFSRMDERSRREFGRELGRRGPERGVDVDQDDDDDASVLAGVLGGMRRRDRGGLGGMLDDRDGGGLLGGPMGKVLTGGIAAIAVKGMLDR